MASNVETLNMRSVTLEYALKMIKMHLDAEDYSPVIIIGKSGIGKTEAISSLAREMGVGFKELRLSHYQESDLVGLPYVDQATGITKHATADLLPDTNDSSVGILLLDEVTSSQKSMRSAVYQLMDADRKLGQYKLPKKWKIIACGNGPSDGGDFRGIEAAFMSRGICFRVEPNLAVWKKWALKKGVHPTVIAYLSFQPDKLHVMNEDNPFDMIACPRNWDKLSSNLKYMEDHSTGGLIDDDNDLCCVADCCVGANNGPSFAAFYRYNKQIISPQAILDGKVKPEALRNVTDEVMYITAQNLVRLLSSEIDLHKTDSDVGVDADTLTKVCNVMAWIVSLPKAGIRLDVAVSMIADLASSLGDKFTNIVMSDKMDELCPDFINFCLESKVVIVNK